MSNCDQPTLARQTIFGSAFLTVEYWTRQPINSTATGMWHLRFTWADRCPFTRHKYEDLDMDIDAKSPSGNAFAIMGCVHRLLRDSGRGDEWPGISERMRSGNYANLCDVTEEVTYGSIRVVNRDDPAAPEEGDG